MSQQRVNVTIPGPGPWGFRLAGGRDFNQPLYISKVTPGGKAHRSNILENDSILSINGYDTSNMTHLDAQNFIKSATGNLAFNLERVSEATIWTPEVSEQPQGGGFNISLKANKQQFQHAGSSHNAKPRLFPGAGGAQTQPQTQPGVVHKQFNSPVGIYSAQNVADSYRGQTESLQSSQRYDDDQPSAWQKPSSYGAGSSQGPKSASFKMVQQLAADENDYSGQQTVTAPVSAPTYTPPDHRPGGTRSVRAPIAKPSTGGAKPANALPVCHKCNRNIMGPFVKVRGNPLHDTCFTCESCGLSLRNKDGEEGFFVINENLYCETCKNRIQHQPGQVNGGSAKSPSPSKSPSKSGPPKFSNDEDEHVHQNGMSNSQTYATPTIQTYASPPEPSSYDSAPADSDSTSFPEPPPFITEHAPVSSSQRNGGGDATDSGYSDYQQDDLPSPPPPSTMTSNSVAKAVLSSTPEPWNPNESYTSPVIRSVRAPSGKMSARPASPEDSNSKPPSQVAGRTTTTTKTFTTSYQSPPPAPAVAVVEDEDDMAAPPPPPPPQLGAGNYAWKSNAPAAPRPSPPPAAYRPGPPPAPKGQPPRSVFPQPPPNMTQRAPPVAPPPAQRGPPVAPPPAQRGPPVAPPPAQRGPPVAPPPAQRGPPVAPPPAQRAPPAPQAPRGPPVPQAPRGPPAQSAPAPAQAGGMARTPYCETCNEQVRGTFVTAFGKNWHPEHFVCAHCHENLQGKGVIEDKGKIYCEEDYMRLYAPKCARCMGSITGECVKAMGAEYHPSCFTCVVCNQPITGDGFHMQDGMTYCKRDFQNKFRGVNCGGCNFPIEAGEAWLEALDKSYHAECFTCTQCQQRLEGQRFYAKGGRPYCQAHGS